MKSAQVLSSEISDFKKAVKASDYNALNRYRKLLAKSECEERDRKLSLVEKNMRVLIRAGEAKRKIRKGGERVEVEREYGDTPANRRLDRVGKKYTVVRYENCEYEERDPVMRRRKRVRDENAPKKTNAWILAVTQARQELGVTGFVCVRKEPSDPENEADQLGAKVYARARELQQATKF